MESKSNNKYKGIQILQSEDVNLTNTIWLLDESREKARCLASKSGYEMDSVHNLSELSIQEYKEIPVEVECGEDDSATAKHMDKLLDNRNTNWNPKIA